MNSAQSKPKDRYHHGALREALVSASRSIVVESGAGALSLRAVARRLGVSHAAPGHHFPDKRALLAAVAAQGFHDLEQAMTRAANESEPDPLASQATGVAYVRFAADNPELFRLMVGRELLTGDSDELRSAAEAAFQVLVREARATLSARGESSEERLKLVTTTAWSLVHGLSMLWLDGRLRGTRTPDALEALARQVTELVGTIVEAR